MQTLTTVQAIDLMPGMLVDDAALSRVVRVGRVLIDRTADGAAEVTVTWVTTVTREPVDTEVFGADETFQVSA